MSRWGTAAVNRCEMTRRPLAALELWVQLGQEHDCFAFLLEMHLLNGG
jgi:hypothetical protein